MENSEIIQKFLEELIRLSSALTSKKYITNLLRQWFLSKEKTYIFLQHIQISEEAITVDKKIDALGKEILLMPINDIFNRMFLPTTKKLLVSNLDQETYNQFKEYGFSL